MMEWKGAWSKDIAYTTGAVVTNGGGTYVALKDIAKDGTAPPSDAWGVLAAPPPPSINWTGPWDPRKQYQISDAVSYDVPSPDDVVPQTEESASTINSYIAVRIPPVGNKPTDTSYWQAMSSNKEIQQGSAFIAACISAGGAAAAAIAASFTAAAAWKNIVAQAALATSQAGLAIGQAGQAVGKANDAFGKANDAFEKAGDSLEKAENAVVQSNRATKDANTSLKKSKEAKYVSEEYSNLMEQKKRYSTNEYEEI